MIVGKRANDSLLFFFLPQLVQSYVCQAGIKLNSRNGYLKIKLYLEVDTEASIKQKNW